MSSLPTVDEDKTLGDAIQAVTNGGIHLALVVKTNAKVVAVITDGDIRRALLDGFDMNAPLSEVANYKFSHLPANISKEKALEELKISGLEHLPLLDKDGQCSRIAKLDGLVDEIAANTTVVIMAGGRGERLKPLTNKTPKPMLKIADKPILQYILENYIRSGFKNFVFSVNYKKEQICDFFGDGTKWGVSIDYIVEDKPLGTAGSLSMLESDVGENLLISNGDILTKLDFGAFVRSHIDKSAILTVGTRSIETQVPFGVIETDNDNVLSILEKPKIEHQISAGIYVVKTEAVKSVVKPLTYLDMPDLINELLAKSGRVCAYNIQEYWLDIGRHETLTKAAAEWRN